MRSKFGHFSSQNASQPQPYRYRKESPPRIWISLRAALPIIQCRWPYNESLKISLRKVFDSVNESQILTANRQEKASAEIRGEFFRPNSRVNFAVDFLVDFFGPFSLEKNRRKKSTQKSTAIFKSEFGSFGAKIHTARIRPWQIVGGRQRTQLQRRKGNSQTMGLT